MKRSPNQRKGALDLIAAEMYSQAVHLPQGWARRTLRHGLQVLVQRKPSMTWRLAIARPDVYPSEQEAAICMRVFEVPAGSEPAKKISSGLYVIEWNWREYSPHDATVLGQPVHID